MPMTLVDLARRGIDELEAMALRGELQPSHLWVAMSGAAEYRAAVARGDVLSASKADERLAQCLACPSVQRRRSERMPHVTRLWCGPPFENRTDTALPTCGCLVGITFDGVPHAGGATIVGSKRCPQGRY